MEDVYLIIALLIKQEAGKKNPGEEIQISEFLLRVKKGFMIIYDV